MLCESIIFKQDIFFFYDFLVIIVQLKNNNIAMLRLMCKHIYFHMK